MRDHVDVAVAKYRVMRRLRLDMSCAWARRGRKLCRAPVARPCRLQAADCASWADEPGSCHPPRWGLLVASATAPPATTCHLCCSQFVSVQRCGNRALMGSGNLAPMPPHAADAHPDRPREPAHRILRQRCYRPRAAAPVLQVRAGSHAAVPLPLAGARVVPPPPEPQGPEPSGNRYRGPPVRGLRLRSRSLRPRVGAQSRVQSADGLPAAGDHWAQLQLPAGPRDGREDKVVSRRAHLARRALHRPHSELPQGRHQVLEPSHHGAPERESRLGLPLLRRHTGAPRGASSREGQASAPRCRSHQVDVTDYLHARPSELAGASSSLPPVLPHFTTAVQQPGATSVNLRAVGPAFAISAPPVVPGPRGGRLPVFLGPPTFIDGLAGLPQGFTIADARAPGLPIVFASNGFLTMTGYGLHEARVPGAPPPA